MVPWSFAVLDEPEWELTNSLNHHHKEYFRENHPNHRLRFCLFNHCCLHRINQHDLLHRL